MKTAISELQVQPIGDTDVSSRFSSALPEFHVQPVWDDEAHVYYSQSNVPGLTIETETLDLFEEVMLDLAPYLILENIIKPVQQAQSDLLNGANSFQKPDWLIDSPTGDGSVVKLDLCVDSIAREVDSLPITVPLLFKTASPRRFFLSVG